MNGRAAKASNRQIRRAFGEQALDTLNQQGETLQSVVVPRLMTLGKDMTTVSRRLDALETRSAGYGAFQQHWGSLTRWQRLRWLVGL